MVNGLKVHPRVRGEHGSCNIPSPGSFGSSPRAWGTPDCSIMAMRKGRFIPTCVGNTESLCRTSGKSTVHPHVRGEHTSAARARIQHPGSSPRAWGTQIHDRRPPRSARFIPTCVGNTFPLPFSSVPGPVHPHVRGEHYVFQDRAPIGGGSSPRAWGTLGLRLRGDFRMRFIPTCVGNTPSGATSPGPASVHPHVRGEHPGGRDIPASLTGSSPRAWGTRDRRRSGNSGTRFIPTCVGNTLFP